MNGRPLRSSWKAFRSRGKLPPISRTQSTSFGSRTSVTKLPLTISRSTPALFAKAVEYPRPKSLHPQAGLATVQGRGTGKQHTTEESDCFHRAHLSVRRSYVSDLLEGNRENHQEHLDCHRVHAIWGMLHQHGDWIGCSGCGYERERSTEGPVLTDRQVERGACNRFSHYCTEYFHAVLLLRWRGWC